MKLLLIVILLIVLANAIVLDKALYILGPKELKRRARSRRDERAAAVYKMAAYEKTLSILLWLKGLAAAAILLLIVAHASWAAALLFIGITAWLVLAWRPPATTEGWVWGWAAMVAPLVAKIMSYLQPVFKKFERLVSGSIHTNTVYEKEDLIELLTIQKDQPENRIDHEELRIAINSLNFGDKKAGDCMTPLRQAKLIGENDEVGPILMDELHKSGFSRFPVVKAGSDDLRPDIIGTLFIKDLIGQTGKAKVKDVMERKVYYVNESGSLRDSLNAFLKTHHHLFIVVNNFEEIVGVLSIEDILEQILGRQIIDEFDKYDDLRAVASQEANRQHQEREHIEETESENTDEDLPDEE